MAVKTTISQIILFLFIAGSFARSFGQPPPKTGDGEENQGPFIDQIEIHGNENISGSAIRQAMFSRESHWWNNSHFDVEIFNEDMRSIIALYNNRGYLDARAAWDSTQINKSRVKLTIQVNEGPQSFLQKVVFEGNQLFPDQGLREEVSINEGEPFSYVKITESTWTLVNIYSAEGYLDVRVDPEISIENQRIDVSFQIEEGNAIYADSIIIRGNSKTNLPVIQRELKIESGELITNQKISASQRNLYRTGLFNSVTITPVRDSTAEAQNTKDVVVNLVESETGELNVGLGYGSEENIRFTGEVLQGNFLGTGQRIGLRGRVGLRSYDFMFRDARAEFLFTAPYFMVASIRLDNSIYFHREIEKNYILNRVGTELTLGRDLFLYSRIYSSAKIENSYYSDYNRQSVLDTSNTRIRSIDLNLLRDTRDNIFDPTSGSYIRLTSLVAGQVFQATNSFLRLKVDYRRYRSFNSTLSFAGNAFAGFLFQTGHTSDIPIFERFYSGGDESIRGYTERSVGPQISGDPVGGNFKFVLRVEARFKILFNNLHAALFIDSGNVWRDISFNALEEMRTGVGIGLRYKTPLGVARIDYGIKVNKRTGEESGRIHFAIGQAL